MLDIIKSIDSVRWNDFETAYGSVSDVNEWRNTPENLRLLFSDDFSEALQATHRLWCSLCHQYAFISSAALPSYNILLYGLKTLNDDLKVELLDIFLGLAVCVDKTSSANTWEGKLLKKLKNDKDVFQSLINHPNELIDSFSKDIVHNIDQM